MLFNICACAEKRDCFAKHQPGMVGCGWLQAGRNFLNLAPFLLLNPVCRLSRNKYHIHCQDTFLSFGAVNCSVSCFQSYAWPRPNHASLASVNGKTLTIRC